MAIDRSKLTKAQRISCADLLAEERLPELNRKFEPVVSRHSFYTDYVKRGIDIVVSLAALLVTLPINVVIGVITFFDVGRPVFFRQQRIGKDGKFFYITKFRNMRNSCDANGDLLPASERVTAFGKIVRKTSLDELLNFWSILKGDMSLIGPRPLVPEYYERWHIRHKGITQVRPGLECPPPVGSHFRTWQEQFEDSVWYVENISFKTDLLMCYRLFRYAVDRKSSKARADVNLKGSFMGYSEDGRAINFDEIPDEIIERVLER